MSMSRRAQRDALVDDLRAFVDQREDQAVHDLVVADLARRDAERRRGASRSCRRRPCSGSRRACRARSRTSRRRSSGRSGPARTAGRRSCCSACRASRRSGACGCTSRRRCRPGRPCGTAPSPCRTSPSPCRPAAACAPSSSRKPAWREYCSIMRLPMKPSHTPETTQVFLIFLPSAITVASTSLAVFSPRTTSSSFITLAGLKKCMPITSCGRLVNAAILSTSSVEVLRGEDRAGLHHLVERLEHLLLDAHVLEHGLDHQVGVLQVVVLQRRRSAAPCAAS